MPCSSMSTVPEVTSDRMAPSAAARASSSASVRSSSPRLPPGWWRRPLLRGCARAPRGRPRTPRTRAGSRRGSQPGERRVASTPAQDIDLAPVHRRRQRCTRREVPVEGADPDPGTSGEVVEAQLLVTLERRPGSRDDRVAVPSGVSTHRLLSGHRLLVRHRHSLTSGNDLHIFQVEIVSRIADRCLMRILMLGRGVIATIYGQALQHSGHHVDHLVRPGRAAEYGDTVQTDVIDGRRGPWAGGPERRRRRDWSSRSRRRTRTT